MRLASAPDSAQLRRFGRVGAKRAQAALVSRGDAEMQSVTKAKFLIEGKRDVGFVLQNAVFVHIIIDSNGCLLERELLPLRADADDVRNSRLPS